MNQNVIDLKQISKKYSMSLSKRSMVGNLIALLRGTSEKKELLAIRDINLSIKRGQTVGIIGENASGKTTLLRIISSITFPTQGSIVIKGRVAGLLDLGAGLYPELTGRENIFLNTALFGMSRKDTEKIFEDIADFSGLNSFIDAQVKTYSQGMLVRLGFSIAIHVKPDIFLIDDSLAVGDEEFQRKCIEKITQLKNQGITIVIVSHDLASLSKICDRGILIKDGAIVKDGQMQKVIVRYTEAVGEKKAIASIDNDKLSVIFNQGKLVLLWQGVLLTKNFGAYSGFFIENRWVMSWEAVWQIKQRQKDSFLAHGVWPEYGISIDLEVSAPDDRGIDLKTKLNFFKESRFRRFAVGFMANELYDRYFDGNEFRRISSKAVLSDRWVDIYKTHEVKIPLVLAADESLPIIAVNFSQNQNKSLQLIQNTEKEFDCRVLQKQYFISESDPADNVSCESSIKLLESSWADQFAKTQQDKKILKNSNTSIKKVGDSFQLYYDGRQLTKYQNILFGFFYRGHRINLFNGEWFIEKIEKKDQEQIEIRSWFKDLGLEIGLSLLCVDGGFRWTLAVHAQTDNKPEYLFAKMCVVPEFTGYFDSEDQEEFLKGIEVNEQITALKLTGGFIGLDAQPDAKLPVLIFQSDTGCELELQNASINESSRILIATSGNIEKLEGQIRLLEDEQAKSEFLKNTTPEEIYPQVKTRHINADFEENKLMLSFDTKQLTAGAGFNSAIFLDARWHESETAPRIVTQEQNKVSVSLKRKNLDITERWEFDFKDKGFDLKAYLKFPTAMQDCDYRLGLYLDNQFTHWINSIAAYEKKAFETGAKHIKFFDVMDKNAKVMGVTSQNHTDETVLFEITKLFSGMGRKTPWIKNDQTMRVLQYVFKIDTQIMDDDEEICVFEGRIEVLGKQEVQKKIDSYCRQNFLIARDDLSLCAIQKRIELIADNDSLVADSGLFSFMRVSSNLFTHADEDVEVLDSSLANWQINKIDEKTLELLLKWDDKQMIEKWVFKDCGNIFNWKVYLYTQESLKIENIIIGLIVPKTFTKWFTQEDNGLMRSKNKFERTLIDNRSNFIGVHPREISEKSPALLFESKMDMDEWLLFFPDDYNKEQNVLGTSPIINSEGKIIDAGWHRIFEGNIRKLCDTSELNNSDKQKSSELKCDGLQIAFQKSRAKILFNDQEITKTLGLYSSVQVNGMWMDSTKARWKIENDEKKQRSIFAGMDLMLFRIGTSNSGVGIRLSGVFKCSRMRKESA